MLAKDKRHLAKDKGLLLRAPKAVRASCKYPLCRKGLTQQLYVFKNCHIPKKKKLFYDTWLPAGSWTLGMSCLIRVSVCLRSWAMLKYKFANNVIYGEHLLFSSKGLELESRRAVTQALNTSITKHWFQLCTFKLSWVSLVGNTLHAFLTTAGENECVLCNSKWRGGSGFLQIFFLEACALFPPDIPLLAFPFVYFTRYPLAI